MSVMLIKKMLDFNQPFDFNVFKSFGIAELPDFIHMKGIPSCLLTTTISGEPNWSIPAEKNQINRLKQLNFVYIPEQLGRESKRFGYESELNTIVSKLSKKSNIDFFEIGKLAGEYEELGGKKDTFQEVTRYGCCFVTSDTSEIERIKEIAIEMRQRIEDNRQLSVIEIIPQPYKMDRYS